MAYEYDVFLSYSRKPPVGDWVRNHFFPLLEMWLPQQLPYQAKVFIDEEMGEEPGVQWPGRLRRALLGSKCLVAVWSPSYFRSGWCVAEWKTMEAREQQLGIGPGADPSRLVVPVRFNDGEHFPDDATTRQWKDLSRWNIPHPHYKDTIEYIEFDRQMQDLTRDIAVLVQSAPAWEDGWPVLLPPSQPAPVSVPQPRWT
jgi:hypothetical protein